MDAHAHDDIDKHVRGYMIVFGTLLVLTLVTVAVSYLHVSTGLGVTIALLIATFKASLVALFFMHLISEKSLIFSVMGTAAAFFFVLLFLPLLAGLDPIQTKDSPPVAAAAPAAAEPAHPAPAEGHAGDAGHG